MRILNVDVLKYSTFVLFRVTLEPLFQSVLLSGWLVCLSVYLSCHLSVCLSLLILDKSIEYKFSQLHISTFSCSHRCAAVL